MAAAVLGMGWSTRVIFGVEVTAARRRGKGWCGARGSRRTRGQPVIGRRHCVKAEMGTAGDLPTQQSSGGFAWRAAGQNGEVAGSTSFRAHACAAVAAVVVAMVRGERSSVIHREKKVRFRAVVRWRGN
uniref:Uncharacterized protein n=1 Tax=Arundo donax TaxID=35708 RepID=A0A0A9A5I8_ARUDO